MIKTILIDDEVHCLDTLSMLITDYCPDLKIVEQCISAKDGLTAIDTYQPALVFLDIEMPLMNGFELLEQFDKIPFSVIFTTSYDQYAIKAIRFSALDYLLKPIDSRELVLSIQKVKNQKYLPDIEQFKMLLAHIQQKEKFYSKIAVPTSEGFELLPADEVVRCEADDNYTHLFLRNNSKIVACRTLKEVEEQLRGFPNFLRVHHSYLVNMNEVRKYIRGEGGYLVMSDGASVNVSRSRKEALMRWFS